MPFSYCHALVRLKDNPAEDRFQVQLVLQSVKDIEAALEMWRKVETNPASTIAEREEAKQRIAYRQRDFGGQWANVKSIISRL